MPIGPTGSGASSAVDTGPSCEAASKAAQASRPNVLIPSWSHGIQVRRCVWGRGAALSVGFATGVFSWLFADSITQATLFNIGFFSLMFGLTGSFRHHHVAFHYPRWLAKWLHSPVMHHIHHSYLTQHWDKNFAAFTSIFDRLFGTLYIPVKDEHTPWGLGPATQDQYRSFRQNVTGPFRDWYDMVATLRVTRPN